MSLGPGSILLHGPPCDLCFLLMRSRERNSGRTFSAWLEVTAKSPDLSCGVLFVFVLGDSCFLPHHELPLLCSFSSCVATSNVLVTVSTKSLLREMDTFPLESPQAISFLKLHQ